MSRIDHHRPQFPDVSGLFKKSYHLEMMTDTARTEVIFRAIDSALKKTHTFCELGCGTGIFSIYAASRCRQVFAVELDERMFEIASENVRNSSVSDRITLIHGNAIGLEIPQLKERDSQGADVALCEMMSIWTIEEPEVPVANSVRQNLLKPDALFLPSRIVNLVELGYHPFRVGNVSMKAAIPLFTGIARPALMTEKRTAKVLDFSRHVDSDLSANIELPVIASGLINCAVLSSTVQVGPEVAFAGSDSLMPPTVVPLLEEIHVNFGQTVRFRASVRACSDLGEATFVAEVV